MSLAKAKRQIKAVGNPDDIGANMTTSLRQLVLLLALGGLACADAPRRAPASPTIRFSEAPDHLFESPDATIRYRDLSAGEPVILLHGYTDRLETMEALADSLAPTHRIVALDLRGFGSSTKYADPSRYGPSMLDDVLHLMDHLGIERAHLVGYSMGALLAANLAARYPERVRTATFLAGPFFPDSAAASEFVRPYVEGMRTGTGGFRAFLGFIFPAASDSLLAAVSDSVSAVNDSSAMIAVLQSLPALTIDPRAVRNLAVPVLAVAGTDDPLFRYSQRLIDWWPGAQLIQLPGVDHEVILTRPSYIGDLRLMLRH